jgi:hypothetical protein
MTEEFYIDCLTTIQVFQKLFLPFETKIPNMQVCGYLNYIYLILNNLIRISILCLLVSVLF